MAWATAVLCAAARLTRSQPVQPVILSSMRGLMPLRCDELAWAFARQLGFRDLHGRCHACRCGHVNEGVQ